MVDRLELHELQAKVAMLEVELHTERATAAANLARSEQMLEAERRMRATEAQIDADRHRALEEAYEARLQALENEVALWRGDDVAGLLRWFATRLATIDSTVTYLDGSGELSEAMRESVDRLRAERVEILAVQVRLRER